MEYLSAHMTCFYQIKNGSRADMLVHGPGNKVSRPFYFLQFGSGIGGAGEDGRNLPQRCRYFYGSGPAELPGPQAV